jgi:hypothetical protein
MLAWQHVTAKSKIVVVLLSLLTVRAPPSRVCGVDTVKTDADDLLCAVAECDVDAACDALC